MDLAYNLILKNEGTEDEHLSFYEDKDGNRYSVQNWNSELNNTDLMIDIVSTIHHSFYRGDMEEFLLLYRNGLHCDKILELLDICGCIAEATLLKKKLYNEYKSYLDYLYKK